ncbi:hypothetical protein FJV41_03865 [Myxococcus llanfairpwllgwyngyllgogerychwyrndrobwllllantysiliogogogochensis]|uniref:Uncharacterized protein n=1 Tax=Myxococcus llanfairpwllgwyngyllgogerychwyrndrobwllllantysiliogogogochensis TaxID=2590453 RepID=A0A540X7K8_9BACT|nr:hypothetical protein [Myxococcus llanfairpwllgwyngyllgogerychwyrndrobwllllantysiliogogogochensis]TQF17291.1 hypothetical protein FJV41_03865 [Myxococcus llanfairpwllgwyngyllgogerychwyrndrobwllllantysiliogogogochensis]
MSPVLLSLSLFFTLGQAPESPPAERPFQARLSFLAGDEDVDTAGSATLWNAALDAHTPELTSGLRAEAALSFFLSSSGASRGAIFVDNGSAFRLRYRPSSWAADEGLALGVYPLSSIRLYLGSTYPVTWGREAFPRRPGNEPALELRLARRQWGVFAALKSAVVNEVLGDSGRYYALLAGGFVDVSPQLQVELKGMSWNQGENPTAAASGAELPMTMRGASLRALWHHGEPIGSNVDLSLYRGDPVFFERFFTAGTYSAGFAASVSLEGSLVSQDLLDPEVWPAQRRRTQSASAAALEVRVRHDFLRVYGLAYYRTPSFIQLDAPWVFPNEAFRRSAKPRAEVTGSLGADYHLERWGLTPGFLARLTLPAVLNAGGLLGPSQSNHLLLRGPNQISVLPAGEDRMTVLTLKATTRWDLGSLAGVVAEVSYANDPNKVEFTDDVTGVAVPVFKDASTFGATVMLQARY